MLGGCKKITQKTFAGNCTALLEEWSQTIKKQNINIFGAAC
jgi:hypothetical protein